VVGLQQAAGNSAVTAMIGGAKPAPAAEKAATTVGPAGDQAADGGAVDLTALADRPELASAGAQIRQSVGAEQAELRAAVAGLRAGAAGDTAARAADVQARTQVEVTAVAALIETRKAEVGGRVAAARAAVQGGTAARSAQARAAAGTSRQALQQQVGTKRADATSAAGEQARLAEEDGSAEARRAVRTSGEVEERVAATGRQQADAYPGEPDVRRAVRDAVTGTARDVTRDMRGKGGEIAGEVHRTAADLARTIRTAGADLVRNLGGNTAEVDGSLTDSAAATADQISGLGAEQAERLTDLGRQATAALDQLKAAATEQIRTAGRQAAETVRSTGIRAQTSLDTAEQDGASQLAAGGAAAAAALGAAPGRRRRAPDALDQFGQQVGGQLRSARTQTVGDLSTAAGGLGEQLSTQVNVFGGALDGGRTQIDTEATRIVGSVAGAAGPAETATGTAGDSALTELRGVHGQVIDRYVGGLGEQVDTATRGWSGQREQTLADLGGKVDEQLRGHREAESRAPAQFDGAAREAAEAATASIWAQIGRGIWNAVKKFGQGLLVLLVLSLAVFAVLLLLGVVVLSVEGFLIAVAVAGLCLLVYAVVTGFMDRWAEYRQKWGDQPWYADVGAALGIAVLSVGGAFGVTQLLEGAFGYNFVTFEHLTPEQRAERITEGVLTIATILLFRGVARRVGPIGEGLTPRGQGIAGRLGQLWGRATGRKPTPPDEPVVLADPYTVLGRKFSLRPDVVDVLRSSRADPVVLDRLLSRGLDADRVALVASDHGAPGLAILDALTSSGSSEAAAVAVIENAASVGRMAEVEALARSGVLARLMSRGLGPDDVVLLTDEVGMAGMETIDGLTGRGVGNNPAVDAARIARRIGAATEVRQLATSGNLENPAGLRNYLSQVEAELAAGLRGKLTTLQDAAQRSQRGRVALEQSTEAPADGGGASGADIIDHGAHEAVQQKVVTGGSRPDATNPVTNNLDKAASQLRGETGERPPAGYRRIADIRVQNPANAMFPLERGPLLDALRADGVDRAMLTGVDEVRVTNGTGTHVYAAGEF
jgi:hypothetical protein